VEASNSANLFVAEFMGTPATNTIDGTAIGKGKKIVIEIFRGGSAIPVPDHIRSSLKDKQQVVMCVRPEQIALSKEHQAGFIPLRVCTTLDSGPDTHMYLQSSTGTIIAERDDARLPVKANEIVYVRFPPDSIRLYNKESGELIGLEHYVP
jgi:ABC-type sugar transport system ATPase subunit